MASTGGKALRLFTVALCATSLGAVLLLAVLPLGPSTLRVRFGSVMGEGFGERHEGPQAFRRACFANQKTLGGALEMYVLDHGGTEVLPDFDRPGSSGGAYCPHSKPALRRLTARMGAALVKDGYLQRLPEDPGAGSDTCANYVVYTPGLLIGCVNHGFVRPPGYLPAATAPREQFLALDLPAHELAPFLGEPDWPASSPGRDLWVPVEWLYAAALLLLGALAAAGRCGQPTDQAWWVLALSLAMPPLARSLGGDGSGACLWLLGLVVLGVALIAWRMLRFLADPTVVPEFVEVAVLGGGRQQARLTPPSNGCLSGSARLLREAADSLRRRQSGLTLATAVVGAVLLNVTGQGAFRPWPAIAVGLLGLLVGVRSFWRDLADPTTLGRDSELRYLTRQGLTLVAASAPALAGARDLGQATGLLLGGWLVTSLAGALHAKWLRASVERALDVPRASFVPTVRPSMRSPAIPAMRVGPASWMRPRSAQPASETTGACAEIRFLGPATVDAHGPGVCRVCGETLGGEVVACLDCDTPHHASCWHYNRGCAVFGCECDRATEPAGRPVSARAPLETRPALSARAVRAS